MDMTADLRLIKITENIMAETNCHTMILYGSHARGEANAKSDYDIAVICDAGETKRDCRFFKDVYLDVFIYVTADILNPDVSFVRMKDGIVLFEKNNTGTDLLNKIQAIFQKGPEKISDWEKQVIVTWSQKMFGRAQQNDIEGYYRKSWLLYDLLAAYFQLRDLWYLGPKESFQWLKQHDFATYVVFEKALKPEADLTNLSQLVNQVTVIPR